MYWNNDDARQFFAANEDQNDEYVLAEYTESEETFKWAQTITILSYYALIFLTKEVYTVHLHRDVRTILA